ANAKASRSGFASTVTLTLTGSVSPISVGGTLRNSLVSARYQYRQRNTGSYSNLANFSVSTSLPNYSATAITLSLDYRKVWDVRVIVTDRLGSNTVDIIVPQGRPIFFIDSVKNSIGFNDYPLNSDEFRINGRIVFGSNLWASGATGGLFGAMDLSNSDIVGVN